MRRRSGRWALFAAGVLVVLTLCVGLLWPVELVFYTLLGWTLFLSRVSSKVNLDWGTVLVAVAAIGVFAVGIHRLFRWLYAARQRNGGPNDSLQLDDADGPQTAPWPWRWSVSIVAGLLLMFIAGTSLVGIAHQVVWVITSPGPMFQYSGYSGETVHRISSRHNLKQIMHGLDAYHEANEVLPPGAHVSDWGHLDHGWQALLLPYFEHSRLYDQIDFSRRWHDAKNASAYKTPVEGYRNPWFARRGHPQTDPGGYPLSDYSANAHVINATGQMRFDQITDGTSRTIMAGEIIADRRAWGFPANWRDPALGINQSPRGFGGPWEGGGAHFVKADGSAEFITEDIDPQVLRALATPTAKESMETGWE